MMRPLILLSLAFCLSLTPLAAQKTYTVSGGELIFSSGSFRSDNGNLTPILRFTLFPHLSYLWNADFTDHIGVFTGLSLRNIGMITRENSFVYDNKIYTNVKTKRRSLALGIPFALKLGSFPRHSFLYAGGQYEWMFHYKEKHFIDDKKIKSSSWFSNKVNPFIPSVFAGIQLPKGINLRFTWMLDDFINTSEVPGITRSSIYYLSLSFHMPTKEIKQRIEENEEPDNYALRD